jgi:hypothetical protein
VIFRMQFGLMSVTGIVIVVFAVYAHHHFWCNLKKYDYS